MPSYTLTSYTLLPLLLMSPESAASAIPFQIHSSFGSENSVVLEERRQHQGIKKQGIPVQHQPHNVLGWGRAYIIVQLGSCTINGIYRCTFSWGLRVRNNSPLASISSFSTDLKRIPHTLFRGPWFHNSIVRLQISSLSIEPLQVIWKSLLKAISGDNRRFCLQNQWINRSLKKQTGCQNSSTLPCSDSPDFNLELYNQNQT